MLLFQFKFVRNPAVFFPWRMMNLFKKFAESSIFNKISIIQAPDHFIINRIGFNGGIMNIELVFLSKNHGQKSIQPRAETYFEDMDIRFGFNDLFKPGIDKHMIGFLHRPMDGMIMFIQFRHENGMRAVFGEDEVFWGLEQSDLQGIILIYKLCILTTYAL